MTTTDADADTDAVESRRRLAAKYGWAAGDVEVEEAGGNARADEAEGDAAKALAAAGALKAASGKGKAGKAGKAGGHWITVFAHGRPIHVHVDGPPHPGHGHGKGKVHTRHYEAESDLHAAGRERGMHVEVVAPKNPREAAAARKAASHGKELVEIRRTPRVERHGDEWHLAGKPEVRVVARGGGHVVQHHDDTHYEGDEPGGWHSVSDPKSRAAAEKEAAGDVAWQQRHDVERDVSTPRIGKVDEHLAEMHGEWLDFDRRYGHASRSHHDVHVRIIRPTED